MRPYAPEDYIKMVGRAIEEALEGRECLVLFFGSVARGDISRTSDIDVGVYCKEGLDPELYLRIMDRIEELSILREVDLVDLGEVKDPEFLENILKEGKVWKGSEDLLKDLEERLKSLRRS